MEGISNLGVGARRNEDIALDLMKYIADITGVARQAGASTGFGGASAARADDHITQLLELYGRCLKAVEGGAGKEAAR